jgi:hypothetical protein
MAALCARSVLARVRADRNAINDWLRSRTDGYLDLNDTGSSVFPGKHVVYKPSVFLYTKGRTYGSILTLSQTWEAGNYVARLFAQPTSTGGPWRIAIFVCRSTGKPPNLASSDIWVTAPRPTPGPGTYVLERNRFCAWGHMLDNVTIDSTGGKTGYFAVGFTSGGFSPIPPASTSTQRVPDAVAVFHTMLGE